MGKYAKSVSIRDSSFHNFQGGIMFFRGHSSGDKVVSVKAIDNVFKRATGKELRRGSPFIDRGLKGTAEFQGSDRFVLRGNANHLDNPTGFDMLNTLTSGPMPLTYEKRRAKRKK